MKSLFKRQLGWNAELGSKIVAEDGFVHIAISNIHSQGGDSSQAGRTLSWRGTGQGLMTSN